MLRPREVANCDWSQAVTTTGGVAVVGADVFGNAVATASLSRRSITRDRASRCSTFRLRGLRHHGRGQLYPFRYSDDEWSDLGPRRAAPRRPRRWGAWAPVSCAARRPIRCRCSRICTTACRWATEPRGEGTRLLQTLGGWGSCRDLAVLFVDRRAAGIGRPHHLRLFLQSRPQSEPGGSTTPGPKSCRAPAGSPSIDQSRCGGSNLIPWPPPAASRRRCR